MRFNRERATPELCEELLPLLHKHYQEIAHFKDIPLSPDFSRYIEMDAKGLTRIFTARSDDGDLRGYAIYFVSRNPHYSTSLQAVQDVIFIDPNHRGTGARLIRWCDEQLRSEGVQATYHHVKLAHNFGPMLERMGYELVDLIYARRLD